MTHQAEGREQCRAEQITDQDHGQRLQKAQSELDAERTEHPIDRGDVCAGPEPELVER